MLSLVLGGAASGKSELAEYQAALLEGGDGPPVTYVATGIASDGEMAIRIDKHRRRRPEWWNTVEIERGGDLAKAVLTVQGTMIVDSLGTWLAGFTDFRTDVTRLATALRLRQGHTVVVSDEVGLGVHPSTDVGLHFRDELGAVNRTVAAVAGEVWLVVAGLPMKVGGK